jgi:chorismate mutase
MDRLNVRLRDLLQERARLAVDIARWKHRRGIAAPDAEREQEMLRRVLVKPGPGFDPGALESIFVAIFSASRRLTVQATVRPNRVRRRPRATKPRGTDR